MSTHNIDSYEEISKIIHHQIRTSSILLIMILSFRTNKSRQTVQTLIRLFLEEQSDQGLHCLSFYLHVLDKLQQK